MNSYIKCLAKHTKGWGGVFGSVIGTALFAFIWFNAEHIREQEEESKKQSRVTVMELPDREGDVAFREIICSADLLKKMSVRDLDFTGKRVLLRTDFNVVINAHGKIMNPGRINQSISTIRYLFEEAGAARCVTIITHIGRPAGNYKRSDYSTLPIVPYLQEVLGSLYHVEYLPDCVGDSIVERTYTCKPYTVFLCENLRFHPEEIGSYITQDGALVHAEAKNIVKFCNALSRLGDVYVMDAFACAHRPHASMLLSSISPRVAGLHFEKELRVFAKLLSMKKIKPSLSGYGVGSGVGVGTQGYTKEIGACVPNLNQYNTTTDTNTNTNINTNININHMNHNHSINNGLNTNTNTNTNASNNLSNMNTNNNNINTNSNNTGINYNNTNVPPQNENDSNNDITNTNTNTDMNYTQNQHPLHYSTTHSGLSINTNTNTNTNTNIQHQHQLQHQSYISPPSYPNINTNSNTNALTPRSPSSQRSVAIIGSAMKVQDKIRLFNSLLDLVDDIIITGGMAYSFKAITNKQSVIGSKFVDIEALRDVERIIKNAADKGVNLHLPFDHVIAETLSSDSPIGICSDTDIINDQLLHWLPLDIGPKSRAYFSQVLQSAQTIVFIGVVGCYEWAPFASGTLCILNDMVNATKNGANTVICGGDAAAAAYRFTIGSSSAANQVKFVSSSNTSSVVLLEGKMPHGICKLSDRVELKPHTLQHQHS